MPCKRGSNAVTELRLGLKERPISMLFGKKKSQNSPVARNLRRRFHHLLMEKRKEGSFSSPIARPRHSYLRQPMSPGMKMLRNLFGVILLGGVILGIVYTVFFSSFFTITKVVLEKNGNAVSGSSIEPFLDKIRGKNLLFLNPDILAREIEQTFKNEVLLVRIGKSYPRKVIAKVEEYPAVFNFTVLAPEKNQKFVLNQIGYSILENTAVKDIPTLILRANKPFPGKGALIEKAKMEPIAAAFQNFKNIFGMKVLEGQWMKTERELHLKTERNFTVWIDLTANVDQQLLKLKRALPKLDIYHEPLEYIDLRIAGGENEKVIFKRR